jgi:hypothetical protein
MIPLIIDLSSNPMSIALVAVPTAALILALGSTVWAAETNVTTYDAGFRKFVEDLDADNVGPQVGEQFVMKMDDYTYLLEQALKMKSRVKTKLLLSDTYKRYQSGPVIFPLLPMELRHPCFFVALNFVFKQDLSSGNGSKGHTLADAVVESCERYILLKHLSDSGLLVADVISRIALNMLFSQFTH